jgi:hypothetical protein
MNARLCPLLLAALFLPAVRARAADGVWQGVNASWSNPANWADSILPGGNDTNISDFNWFMTEFKLIR